MMLYHTDPGLLLRYESNIIECRSLEPATIESIMERLRMLSWDGETCWRALEEFCEKEKDKQFVNEVNFQHAYHLVEAVARNGEKYSDRVLALLAEEIDDVSDSPMKWLEPLAAQLAGEIRLEAAIPYIIGKLKIKADFLNEECVQALIKIGTDSAVEAIYEPFAKADWHYRLFASEPLENIHTDLAVTRCLELLAKEKDPGIKTNLGYALLSHFAYEGIEAVRQLILSGNWDPLVTDLRQNLVTACTIMGERFPEYDQWKAVDEEKRRAERRQLLWKQMGLDLGLPKETKRASSDLYHGTRLTKPAFQEKKQVGRNDPCPCGSGKKYKKCCFGRKRL
jgi:hypothetical protein